MKREKRLTKRERKALAPPRPGATGGTGATGGQAPQHIHCIACGRHIDAHEFQTGGTAKLLECDHGSTFAACVNCEAVAVARIAEHDRTGNPVQSAGAWH